MLLLYVKLIFSYWKKNIWVVSLSCLSVSLGVSLVLAMNLALESSKKAFDRSIQAISGKATHRIKEPKGPLNESVYFDLRTKFGITNISPMIQSYALSPAWENRPMQLLGVDVFAEADVREYFSTSGGAISQGQLDALLTQPGAVLLPQALRDEYKLTQGQLIAANVGSYPVDLLVAGFYNPKDPFYREATKNIILADISSAQEMTGRVGKLDYIDVVVPKVDGGWITGLKNLLPAGLLVESKSAQAEATSSMASAFELNLRFLSLFGLLVSSFLVFNSLYFFVSRRKKLFGVLRALGFRRKDIFAWIVLESFWMGLCGSVLGVVLGIPLGNSLIKLVTRTITDFYYVVDVRSVSITAGGVLSTLFLGSAASVAAGLFPAWLASLEAPKENLVFGETSRSVARFSIRMLGLSIFLAILATCMFRFSSGVPAAFAAALFSIIAVASVIPSLLYALAWLLTRWKKSVLIQTLGSQMASHLKITWFGVASMTVALSMAIAIGQMVSSFRVTLHDWLGQTLTGDIYVSPRSISSLSQVLDLNAGVVEVLRSQPHVVDVSAIKVRNIETDVGSVQLAAIHDSQREESFRFYKKIRDDIRSLEGMKENGVFITEPLARKNNLMELGREIRMRTPSGEVSLKILGIVYDYGSEYGTMYMNLDKYQNLFRDSSLTGVSLSLDDPGKVDSTIKRIQSLTSHLQILDVRSNRSLMEESMQIFDRTFLVTDALRAIAFLISMVSIFTALLCKAIRALPEQAVYRFLGVRRISLVGMMLLESIFYGSICALVCIPIGILMSLVMIFAINVRAFGWTIAYHFSSSEVVMALVISMTACVLAVVYPSWLVYRMNPREVACEES